MTAIIPQPRECQYMVRTRRFNAPLSADDVIEILRMLERERSTGKMVISLAIGRANAIDFEERTRVSAT